jgi:hypothetical protein
VVIDHNDPDDLQIRLTRRSTGGRVDAAARKEAFFTLPPVSGATVATFKV